MHNSWFSNVESLKRGTRSTNPLEVHPDDAARLGVDDGDDVVVRSDWGEIDAMVRIDDAVRPGVVADRARLGPSVRHAPRHRQARAST